MKKLLKFFEKRQVVALIILSIFLNVLIEVLARKSLLLGLKHIIFNAPIFLYNTLLILSTLSISFLFRKRYFFALVITIIWLALGIGNFVVKLYRTTPLSAIDFTIAKSGIKIMPMYFAYWQIILLAIAVLAVIAFIIFAWIKLPKKKPNYKIAIPAVAAVALFTTLVTILYIQFNVLSNNFRNLFVPALLFVDGCDDTTRPNPILPKPI